VSIVREDLTEANFVKTAKIRTIHFGIGPVGAHLLRLAVDRPDIEVAAVIDPHPDRAGKDAGESAGINRSLGLKVSYDHQAVLASVPADVVLHATESGLTAAHHEILEAVSAQKSVISACGELAFPWTRYPDIARKLDQRAREAGVRVLGIGVSTGFLMDTLTLVSAAACQYINSVRVTRRASVKPDQLHLCNRLGVGLSVEGFQGAARSVTVGHAGLRESLLLIADTLGWRPEEIVETIEPVLAKERIKTDYFVVEKGYVTGAREAVRGLVEGRELIALEIEMSLGVKDPFDEITIDGRPPLTLRIPGGTAGDAAAAALMANCIPAVVRSHAAGLLSMRDMPVAPYRTFQEEPGPGLQPQERPNWPSVA